MSDLTLVAVDIETTGVNATDTVTAIGFALPVGCRVFVQTNGRSTQRLGEVVNERVDTRIDLSVHDSEHALLNDMVEYVTVRLAGDDLLLTAYNGETWHGGFDLPFLRTRLAEHNLPWPFLDLPYADLYPLVSDLWNTTIEGDSQSDLVTAYETLCAGKHGDLDPFLDSQTAVKAFNEGDFADLVAHNVADILRTAALGRLAQQYCSKSDFQLKSLTPVTND